MKFTEAVLLHSRLFPRLQAQDLVKLAYQSALGSEHMMPEPAAVLAYLRQEMAQVPQTDSDLFTPIAGGLVRLNLCALEKSGLRPETVAGLFRCARGRGGAEAFGAHLAQLKAMSAGGELPVYGEEMDAYLRTYRAAGCPAVHHSDVYRAAYAPAYRIVPEEARAFLPLFQKIDRLLALHKGEKRPVRVAIDGMSAAGKSSLSALLAEVYGANLFHMDDFFLPEERKTPERLAESGGNVDYERFYAEVAQKDVGIPFSYRPYRCHPAPAGLTDPVETAPRPLSIVEGAYSLHPALWDGYDLRVFYRIDPDQQRERILVRNGTEMLSRFLNEWIPLENRYIASENLPARCDLILDAPPAEDPD